MSKIGRDRIIALQERAEELGFSTITEAIDAGYHEVQDLVAGTFTLEKIDEQEKAHEAWLKEKNKVLGDLDLIVLHLDRRDIDKFTIQVRRIIENTIDFIEKGEC